jgi:aromatic-L-amino-acid/L-tryptophan decarboxylase
VGSAESPLELDADTMRELGYRVVDVLVDRISGLDDQAAWRGAERALLEVRLREPPPQAGVPFDELLSRVTTEVLEVAGRIDHPRFFAFIPSCPTWPGILGDFLASGFNIFQGTWLASAGPSALELVVLDWFKEWVGYPEEASGLLLTGGSEANLTAIACARAARLGGADDAATIYYSDQTHSSVERAARVLGFAPDALCALPVDGAFRLRPDELAAAVEADRQRGRRPFLVVANAGTTNTGAVDQLGVLAAVAADLGLWLHVDAAYGGFAVLTERGARLLDGLGRADSVALDPHKWLYQPYAAGCLLVREGQLLGDAFHVMPDYLQDTAAATGQVNFADRGIQLTRPARALKIWLSLQYFGVDAFRRAIDRALDLAKHAERRVRATPSLELLTPASLGVVCFRRTGTSSEDETTVDRRNAALVARLATSGEGLISSTRLGGRYALRLCVMNHRATSEDVERVIDFLARAEVDY